MAGAGKTTLLCYFTHAPLFESCFPLLERLNERDNIAVKVILDARLPRIEAGIAKALAATKIKVKRQHRARIELLSFAAIKSADAVLSHSDPLAYRKASRPRDWYLPASGTPQIFVQHGLLQSGINWPAGALGLRWYSKLLLWWDEFDVAESAFIEDDIVGRVQKVGFIKKAYAEARELPNGKAVFFAEFKQRLLICTSFGDHLARGGTGDQADFYSICDEFCTQNPDVLLILRPHRGRQDADYQKDDQALLAKHRNILIMDRHTGDFAYNSIHDILSHCDGVVTHVSSVILDAIYAGIPVGVLHNRWPKMDSLPNITSVETLETFAKSAPSLNPKETEVYQIYGAIEQNLERAALAIERFMIDAKP